MTDKKTEKVMYKTHSGEIFDVKGAIMRHSALTDCGESFDVRVKSSPGYGLEFIFTLGAEATARLVKILNSAPVNGDPLNAIVNLMDVVMLQHERDRLARFLEENNSEPTLENIATWYLESGSKYALPVDVVLAGKRKRYAVARVTSKFDNVGKELSTITFRAPGETVTVARETDAIDLEDLEGLIIGCGSYRILHALKPEANTPLGGFILERTA